MPEHLGVGCPQSLPIRHDPRLQSDQIVRRRAAAYLGEIFLLHLEAGMHQPVGQRPIVRQEHQSFGLIVKPTDGKEPGQPLRRQEVADDRSPPRIGQGGQHAGRLVQHQVDETGRCGDELPIARHLVETRRDLGPELSHDPAIDADPPLEDQLLTAPTGTESASRKIALQPFLSTACLLDRRRPAGRVIPPSRSDRWLRVRPPSQSYSGPALQSPSRSATPKDP